MATSEDDVRRELAPEFEAFLLEQVLDALNELPATMARFREGQYPLTRAALLRREQDFWRKNQEARGLLDWLVQRSHQALLAAEDALVSLSRVLRPPSAQIAPGGIARDILESSAVVLWLTDANCAPLTRLDRAGRLWASDLTQGRLLKLQARKDSLNPAEWDGAIAILDEALSYVARQREAVGLDSAKAMIPATQLVALTLNAAYDYRMWSNLSHGNPFATASFRRLHAVGKASEAQLYPVGVSVNAYARATMSVLKFARPGLLSVASAQLHDFYDRMGIGLQPNSAVRSFLEPR